MQRADIERRVERIVDEMFGPDEECPVILDRHFAHDCGADSIDLVELTLMVEEDFDLDIPDADMVGFVTGRSVVDYVLAHAQ